MLGVMSISEFSLVVDTISLVVDTIVVRQSRESEFLVFEPEVQRTY